MATSTTYIRAFWNVMKGKEENNQNLSEGFDNAGAYVAPDEFREGFNTALAKENIFRRFATVINLSSAEGKIQAVSSTGQQIGLKTEIQFPKMPIHLHSFW